MVGIFNNMEIPEKIRVEGNATDTVWGKYSPSSVWRKVGDNLFLDNDILADKSRQQWAPEVFRLFNNSVEFTKFNTSYQFSGAGDREVFAYNIVRMAVNIESKGRGYDLRRIFKTDDPIYINTYAEIYFTDREYMTVSEAKRWEKEPLLGDEIGIHPPTDAPELQSAIAEIVERVKNFDYNRYRLNSKTDRFYEVMEKYEDPSSKKKKKKRSLNDLIRRNEYQQRKKKEMRIPSSNYIK